jgi:hypothetical protein
LAAAVDPPLIIGAYITRAVQIDAEIALGVTFCNGAGLARLNDLDLLGGIHRAVAVKG